MTEDEIRRMAQIEWFKNSLQHHETLTEAVSAFEHALLRGSLVLNGGAMIALLTLYGAKAQDQILVYWPLIIWTIGLLLCAAAAYFAALSQWQFQINSSQNCRRVAKDFFDLDISGTLGPTNNKRIGQALRIASWVAWTGSAAAFGIGIFAAASQFS